MFTNEVESAKKKWNLFTFKDLEVLYNITIMFVFLNICNAENTRFNNKNVIIVPNNQYIGIIYNIHNIVLYDSI